MKLDSFAIERTDGNTVYAEARNARIDRHGNLVLYSWLWKTEAAFKAGTWLRVMRGLTGADLEGGE